MNQAAGWLIIGVTRFTCMPFFAAVKEAKFRSFVTPGMALTVGARIEHEGSGYMVTHADISHDGKRLCNAEITFRLAPFPSPRFRDAMLKVASEIAFPMEAAHG
jgi:3-hydroxyacyl-[acyl-carrier-protein] dehydratase